ncbi:uroporphyrinogen-III synthase [Osmia bicornis bicornis]|uniref:uroporphyrinogen-III synthase n=1 Tax=Osmia bicornis bicornis TaxID=1437191 RepID=UPI0010F79763|nr:uroporphyrinogen-III synthase [Osmia bicornis bicornis]
MTIINFANMAIRYKSVVLCRGLSEKNDSQEAYVKTLKTAGYVCDCLPTLCFEFINGFELQACLLSPLSYHGMILTSRRAAEAIGLVSKDDNVLHPWKSLPVYCVGTATESFAKSHLGSENCFGSQTGNSKELAELLVASIAKKSKPLLYPCSEIGRETIEKTLNENDISVHKIIAYRTLPSKTLEQDLLKFLDNSPKIFVFFSPSTVEHIIASLRKISYNMCNIKAVAIGPVTRQALFDAEIEVYATASKPDPASLLEAISNAEKIQVKE